MELLVPCENEAEQSRQKGKVFEIIEEDLKEDDQSIISKDLIFS